MSTFQDYKDIIDRFLRLQDRLYPEAEEYFKMGEGRVSLLRIRGLDGGSILLKCENKRIKYAQGNETPVHIFTCSPDTFLNILTPGVGTLREAITKNHFMIEDVSTGNIDLVEAQKWSVAFSRLKGLIRKYVGAKVE